MTIAPTRTLRQASAWLFAGQASSSVAALGSGLLAARFLGPEGRGEVALAFVIGNLLAPIALLGIDTYLLARARADGSYGSRLLRLGAVTAVGAGAVTLLASAIFGVVVDLPVGVLAAGALGGSLRPGTQWLQARWLLVEGHRRVGAASALAAITAIALTLTWGIGARSAAVFCTISLVSYAVNLGALLGAPTPRDPEGGARRVDRSTVLRFGWRTVAADGIQMANYRVDLLLVAAFASVADVGVYTVAVTAAEFLWLVPSALGRAFLVRLGGGGEVERDVARLARSLAAVLAAVGLGGVLAVRLLAGPLLGAGFERSWVQLLALLPGVVVLGACKPVASALLARGLVSANLRASAAGLIVLVGSGLVLVPSHGVLGAAAASSASYLVTALLVVRAWRRSTRAPALGTDAVVFAPTS